MAATDSKPIRQYTVFRDAPPNRQGTHDGPKEEHFPEAGVMLAFAKHLIERGASHVELRPDGEHGKQFDIRSWLEAEGFAYGSPEGRTAYCGIYERELHKLTVRSVPGDGDVFATVNGLRIVAECKGGIVNTRHPGQKSKLRRAVIESVGQLLCRPQNGERQIAVVPDTPETRKWADRIAPRARAAGIEVALIDRYGALQYVQVP